MHLLKILSTEYNFEIFMALLEIVFVTILSFQWLRALRDS